MRYRDAARLHNGDEVRLKETKEVCTVYQVTEKFIGGSAPRQYVEIQLDGPEVGFTVVSHLDVS